MTRRDFSVVGALFLNLPLMVMVGCATQAAPLRSLGRPYTAAEIAIIMHMRDGGEGLNDVAAVVGGTRLQVKQAESAEKLRRRSRRASPIDPSVLSCR
jgi:hypothetical protein